MHKLPQKKSAFKVFLLFLFLSPSVFAQEKFLKKLIPEKANLQYAGSIGFLSAGFGYEFFNEKTSLNFNMGYVPESLGGELTIFSIKFDYKPWSIKIKDKAIFYPFNPVIFPSYTLGENFDFKFEAPQYRDNYYFWSTALRLHLGASTEIKLLKFGSSKIRALGLYAEANTNDLYAISYFQNRTSTPFYKMFKVGYGAKVYF